MQRGAEVICLSSGLRTSMTRVKFHVKTYAGLCICGSVFPLLDRFGQAPHAAEERRSPGRAPSANRMPCRNVCAESNERIPADLGASFQPGLDARRCSAIAQSYECA